MNPHLIVLPIVLPIAAALLAAAEKVLPRLRLASVGTFGALVLQLLFAWWVGADLFGSGGTVGAVVGGYPAHVGIALLLDGMGRLVGVLVAVVGLAAVSFAAADPDHYDATFYILVNLLFSGMYGVLLTNDLFNLFVFLEILGIAAYLLIVYLRKGHALLASFRYLVLSSVAMAFFLLGVFLVYRQTGTFELSTGWRAPNDSPTMRVAVAALMVGVGVRAAFFPLHSWLPDAHAYAPHPVSALLSGVMIKVSLVALIRILRYAPLGTANLTLWLGVITAVVGVSMALVQVDAKRLLAYHSVSQIGYIIAAYGAVAEPASQAGAVAGAPFFHVVAHALFKSLLFLSVGFIVDRAGERNLTKIGGMGRRYPGVFLVFGLAAAAISGVPPTVGYVSKKLVQDAVGAGSPIAAAALLAVSVGTAASFVKLSGMFWKAPPAQSPTHGATHRERKAGLAISFTILAVPIVGLGLAPDWWQRAMATVLHGQSAGIALVPKKIYSVANLLTSVQTVGLGVLLYLGVTSPLGYRLSHALRRAEGGLDRWLASAVLAMGVLSMALVRL